jgi:hypothetical protein
MIVVERQVSSVALLLLSPGGRSSSDRCLDGDTSPWTPSGGHFAGRFAGDVKVEDGVGIDSEVDVAADVSAPFVFCVGVLGSCTARPMAVLRVQRLVLAGDDSTDARFWDAENVCTSRPDSPPVDTFVFGASPASEMDSRDVAAAVSTSVLKDECDC